jgi:hypothetical protein
MALRFITPDWDVVKVSDYIFKEVFHSRITASIETKCMDGTMVLMLKVLFNIRIFSCSILR